MSHGSSEQALPANKARRVFKLFEDNTISYIFAKNKNDEAKMRYCDEQEENILIMLTTPEEVEAFDAIFFAEYKEYIYNEIHDPTFDMIESATLAEYHAFAMRNFSAEEVYHNKHDPNHEVFKDDKIWYSFYHMSEVDGENIFEIWEHDDFDIPSRRHRVHTAFKKLLVEIPKVLDGIEGSEDRYCLDILLMAEYKELVYRSTYEPSSFNQDDQKHLDNLETLVAGHYDPYFIANHKHIPEHYIFDKEYKFYTELESQGLDVL